VDVRRTALDHPVTSGIHRTAADGFVRPEVYEKGRPSYPDAVVGALGIDDTTRVVDLGCGTGKFTRLVRHARTLGVEPLATMLGGFRSALPGVPVVSGTAEAIPVRDSVADVVACASAFHWFDHERALPEIHRVLRDGGRLGIVWNRRDKLDGWAADFWQITEQHRGDTPGYRSGAWREALESSPYFGPIAEHWFEYTQRLDRDGLLARIASISFIETLPDDERVATLAECLRFLDSHPDTKGRTVFALPYHTVVYVTEAV
jgi:SAM-dependent methyltransferase